MSLLDILYTDYSMNEKIIPLSVVAVVAVATFIPRQVHPHGKVDCSTLATEIVVVSDTRFCAPCRKLQPTLDRMVKEGYKVTKYTPRQWFVKKIPTIFYLRDGKSIRKDIGVVKYEDIVKHLVRPEPSRSVLGGGNLHQQSRGSIKEARSL